MSELSDEILKLSSSLASSPLYTWNTLLNFFKLNMDDLRIEDIKLIVDKSEQCRIESNKRGKTTIEKCDVRPNVYEYYENYKKEK